MSEYPNPFAAPQSGEPVQLEEEDDRPLADLGQRFLGNFVDGLFMLACGFAAVLVALPVRSLTRADELPMLVGAVVFFVAYNAVQISLVLSRGQSVGKILLGSKIVRVDGQPLGLMDGVLLRGWLPTMAGLILGAFISLPDALFIFREDRRCIHDHIAGTKVIRL